MFDYNPSPSFIYTLHTIITADRAGELGQNIYTGL